MCSPPAAGPDGAHAPPSADHQQMNGALDSVSRKVQSVAGPVVYRNATIITGEEDATPFVSDLLVSDGLISKIAPSAHMGELPAGCHEIDCTGLCLSPGFIDMHAHSDLYLLTHPAHEPKITQGCTTEVVGQDGISYYPIRTDEQYTAVRNQIAAWNGNPSEAECQTLHKGVGMFEWRSVGEYLDCLEKNGTSTNVAVLVPQGNLRLLACGPCDTVASQSEIEDQIELLRQAMDQGAVGMSSGLTYTPGMYASTSELAQLCSLLSASYPSAFYAPHHRSYGHRAMESYVEMLELSLSTGCPVHLTHATLNYDENKGRAPELVSLIDEARGNGADITLDTYPYLPGCTTLSSLLPSWAGSGGPAETLKRLKDRDQVARIREAIEVTGCDGGHGIPTEWSTIQVASTSNPALAHYNGRRVAEIAQSLSKEPFDVFIDILIQDDLSTSSLMHVGNEENVQTMMQHPTHCSGSDAILHGPKVHPRAWGTMARYLGHYSRDLGLIALPQMIAHLTSRPAKRLSIYPHRGVLREGSAADIVLFDPKTVKDTATFEEPKRRAAGIKVVMVNGTIVLDHQGPNGLRAGKALRRRKDGSVF